MIRTTLKSILCLVLSPLLGAQQISHEPTGTESNPLSNTIGKSVPISNLPPGTRIVLLLPAFRPRPLVIDSPVELAVLQDVTINRATVLRAGTAVPAILTDGRHGSFAVRQDETIRIHARDLQSGRPLRIRLPGERHERSLQNRGDFPWAFVIFALVLIILPIAVLRNGDK